MKNIKFLIFSICFILLSCSENSKLVSELEPVYTSIKKEFAPDKRVELFDIHFEKIDNQLILEGETTSLKAYKVLLDSLQNRNLKFTNNIRVLPDTAVGDLKYAIARNSVINIRSQPKHSAELGTQGLLGMPLKVLDKKGDFYRVQTPDNYISWVDKGGITRMNKAVFDRWNASKKITFTQNFGYVYADSNFKEIVSDITLGGSLKILKEDKEFYKVVYPDKRIGFVKIGEASIRDLWQEKLYNFSNDAPKSLQENIELEAKKMLGFPYLWGGTSSKGVDCSGFTKMVYLMNGFIIPRDASQQINAGKIVDKNLKFEGLEKGDLLFFGKKATSNTKQRVTHVGIWLGNGKQEFIHASGNVHISSMDAKEPNYDDFNKNRYLGSRRYLGNENQNFIYQKFKH